MRGQQSCGKGEGIASTLHRAPSTHPGRSRARAQTQSCLGPDLGLLRALPLQYSRILPFCGPKPLPAKITNTWSSAQGKALGRETNFGHMREKIWPLLSSGGTLKSSLSLIPTANQRPSSTAQVSLEGFRGELKSSSSEAAGPGLALVLSAGHASLAILRIKIDVYNYHPHSA